MRSFVGLAMSLNPINHGLLPGCVFSVSSTTASSTHHRGNTLNSAQVPSPGTTAPTPTILADGFAEAIGLAVDADAGIAYVTALDGTVRAVPTRSDAPAQRVVAHVTGRAFTGIVGVAS